MLVLPWGARQIDDKVQKNELERVDRLIRTQRIVQLFGPVTLTVVTGLDVVPVWDVSVCGFGIPTGSLAPRSRNLSKEKLCSGWVLGERELPVYIAWNIVHIMPILQITNCLNLASPIITKLQS